MLYSFALYKNDKFIGAGKYCEDVESFVEELKRLNPKFVDRRDFQIRCGNEIFKTWSRK